MLALRGKMGGDVVMTSRGGSVELKNADNGNNFTESTVRTSWLEPCGDLGSDLELVESHIRDVICSGDRLMSEVSGYLFEAGGKRLRPALVLLAARLGGGGAPLPISMASAIEVLHTATLLHDDVVDEAATRRHRPSANARWGNAIAILAGGYLLSRAMQVFASAGDAVNHLVCDTIEKIWRGQSQETQNAHNLDLDEGTYFEIIERKTAALYELSCRVGSLMAGLPDQQVEALASYGRDLGVAFQLIDDVLDVVSDEETLGKSPAADMRGGIYTLPVIHTLGQGDPDASRLRVVLAQRDPPEEELEEALDLLRHNRSIPYTVGAAVSILHRAQGRVECLPDSDAKKALRRLAQYVLVRPDVAQAVSQYGQVVWSERDDYCV